MKTPAFKSTIDSLSNYITIQNESTILLNKELNETLIKYNAKDDFYTTALSAQSDQFIFYVTCLLGITAIITALISFYWRKSTVKRFKSIINDETESLKVRMINAETRGKELERRSANATCNVCAIIANEARRNGDHLNSALFGLDSACYLIVSNDDIQKSTQAVNGNLIQIIEDLSVVIKDDSLKEQVKQENNRILNQLKEIRKVTNIHTQEYCSEINLMVAKFIKDIV